MLIRSAIFACAAAMLATPALAETPGANARCEQTTFRVYFQHGSSGLDDLALQTLAAAERNIAECDYAELRVTVDGARGAQRGEAIRAAASGRGWDAVRIEQRSSLRRASMSNGPDYAEVTMSPNALPVNQAMPDMDAGV